MSEPREALALALTGYLTSEQVQKLIDEILAIEKRVDAEFTCRECNKRQKQWILIPDAKAVALALPDFLNQAFGRPNEASSHQDPVQFYRLTNMEEVDALRTEQKERGGHTDEGREDGEVHPAGDVNGEGQADSHPDLQVVDPGDDEAVASG